MVKITVQNENKTVSVARGSNLRKAAIAHGVQIYTGFHKVLNCHGAGRCSSCAIEVVSGQENLSARTTVEEKKFKSSPNARLACQTQIEGDVTIRTH